MSIIKPNSDLFLSAFAADPLFCLAFGDDDKIKITQAQRWYFDSVQEYCQLHGKITAMPDNLGSIAWVKGSHFPQHFDLELIEDKSIAAKIHRLELHENVVEEYIGKNANNYAYICLLAVDNRARGRGYAKQLLTKAMQQMKDCGLEYCWLTTENPDNPSFYKKMGFELVHQCVTGIGIDTYFFRRKI